MSLGSLVAQHCQVSIEPIDAFRVRFTIRCEVTVRVLLRQTPLEGVKGNIFVIQTCDGQKPVYTGRMVKRGAPTDSEYGVVQQGSPLSVVIDLQDYYELLSHQQYRVNFQGNGYSNQLPDSNVIDVPSLKSY